MEALLTLGNVEFRQSDGWTVRVKQGEEFTVKLLGAPQGLQWTTSQDPVLDLTEQGQDAAKIIASNKGTSRVLLLNEADSAVFRLTFEVFDPEEAAQFDVPAPNIERM